MTSFDLSSTFIEKLKSRAWFWYRIYLISWKLKIWPIFQIFDLGWSRVTSWPLFWNSDVKSVLLIYDLPTFNVLWNLTLNEPKFVIWPQIQFFFNRNYSEIPLIILSYFLLRLVNLCDKTNTFCGWRNVENCISE